MGKYLKLFENHSGYTAFINGGGGDSPFLKPNVSYCENSEHVHFNPYDYSDRYLTFIAREDGATFTFNGTTVDDVTNVASYSLDNGTTWMQIASGVSTPSINTGERILWKGEMTPRSSRPWGIGSFTSTKEFDIEGNVMSLIYGDNFAGQNSLDGYDNAFFELFVGSYDDETGEYSGTKVVNAKNLSLYAATLSTACYYGMFEYCTSLITTPKLTATTLTDYCYSFMFEGCTSLTTAPQLPATTLADYCYAHMFGGCTSLTSAPELPATTLANSCYMAMFSGGISLTNPPELPVTTLSDGCYWGMFSGCTSLTTAPVLSATTLVKQCYQYMFSDCTNLKSITCLATDMSATYCTYSWVAYIYPSGTFTKSSSADWSGMEKRDGIPQGWTIVDAS